MDLIFWAVHDVKNWHHEIGNVEMLTSVQGVDEMAPQRLDMPGKSISWDGHS
jgi:hypothetical protein